MPGVINATVTGTVGPGNVLTAAVFSNQSTVQFNAVTSILTLVDTNGTVLNISIAAATTVTVVLSAAGGNYTVTVS